MSNHREHPLREHLHLFGPALVITLLGFILAYQFVDPAPPSQIRIASGQKEGAYQLFAQRYREQLAEQGIELEILTSAGSLENIQLLQSGAADIGFVQGGLAGLASAERLLSMGSFYYEPLWLFHRKRLELDRVTGLKQRRVAVGAEGSGTRVLALQLLQDNKLDAGNVEILSIGGRAAADALQRGEVDAAFFVSAPQSPLVSDLLRADNIRLMDFTRADAYTRLHPHLSSVLLPEGVVDMERNLPSAPTRLLSATANLVTTERLHPALVDLLIYIGGKVHGKGGWFEGRNEFPSPSYSDFPLSRDAVNYYERGPSLLQRYLPFWTASLLDRLKVMLLPLIALLLPLIKVMPAVYNWRMRSRIYPWYREVLAIDRKMADGTLNISDSLRELDNIERQVVAISVPLSFADQLYDLRRHIGLARQRLEHWRGQSGRDG